MQRQNEGAPDLVGGIAGVPKISVLHIDKSQLYRSGLRQVLEGTGFSVAWEGETWRDARPAVERLRPDILIADFRSDVRALKANLAHIKRVSGRTRIIILAETSSLDVLAVTLAADADAYLTKDVSGDALRQSLQLVHLGHKVLPRELTRTLVRHGYEGARNRRTNGLSLREIEVLSRLRAGFSNKQIANQLQITEGTVKVHLKAILKKVKAANRTQAAIWAMDNGISPPAAA